MSDFNPVQAPPSDRDDQWRGIRQRYRVLVELMQMPVRITPVYDVCAEIPRIGALELVENDVTEESFAGLRLVVNA